MAIEGLNAERINSKVERYWSVSVVEETTSTQMDLVENFRFGQVLIAEFQSAGRGRLDRKFVVPSHKGLTFSFALKFDHDFGWIPLITGLAVSDAINTYLSTERVEIKWPNDLLIDGDKVAGILSEKVKDGVVVGIGINIFQKKEELPIPNAISLSMIAEVDREELLILILKKLGEVFSNIENFESAKHEYRERCGTIGRVVEASLPNGESIEDQAIGIGIDGSLLLRSREITVADIVHLR